MANETKQIAQFIARLTYDDIPEEVIKRAKIVMLDTLSCAVAGYTKSKEECEWAIKIAKEWGGNEEASIWCDGFKASAMAAAFANATMVHTVDFDDTHIDSISHFGAGLLATVLALAEKTKANGKEMITAFIAGFEAAARTGNSVNKGAVHHHYKYWHPTATCGTIGCAAAAAKMYKLNELETEYALGLGIDQASGLRYCVDKGDYSKSLHLGWAAMRGIMSAQIISIGANGPLGLLEYPTGFCNATCSEPHIEYITEGLGEKYEIMRDALKMYPTIHGSHSSIEATTIVVTKNDIKPEDIEEIFVQISPLAKGQGVNYAPASVLAARLSLPFSMALAAKNRKVELNDFTEDLLTDKDHLEFMKKVKVEPEPEFNIKYPDSGFTGKVTVTTKDGKKYSEMVIYPKAHPERFATDEEFKEKYDSLARITWDDKKAEKVYDLFMNLENNNIGDIIPLLASC